MKTMTKKKSFTLTQTDDGSPSFHSHLYNEGGHSTTGAKSETIKHYIEGCKVLDVLNHSDKVVIFEVGFGIGLGFLTTLEHIPESKKLIFYSVEIDQNLIEYAIENNDILKNLNKKSDHYQLVTDQFELNILNGNARETVPSYQFEYNFDCIYQDAFSPKRNAILWTTEWFSTLKELSHSQTILATYSSSSSIRKSLIKAGWKLYKGDKFGPKRSSTRAKLIGKTENDILLQLERSPAVEITDDNYMKYQEGKVL
jgi:tRNA U34 5-methylaminomethyl-2-thiouridine-forming methyltransferase MnmC